MNSEGLFFRMLAPLESVVLSDDMEERNEYAYVVSERVKGIMRASFKEGCEDMYEQTLTLLRDWGWFDVAEAIANNREHKQFIDSFKKEQQ